MDLEKFLILSAIIFAIGLYGVLARRNVITVLMSLELMFTAVILAAVTMSRYVASREALAQTGVASESVLADAADGAGVCAVHHRGGGGGDSVGAGDCDCFLQEPGDGGRKPS